MAIATSIPMQLMTDFVVQGHKHEDILKLFSFFHSNFSIKLCK